MLFRTDAQKRDLAWDWNRGDRAFFQAGSCHILTDVFLRRFPTAGFRPLLLQPHVGFRGIHVVAASSTTVFDWHGFSGRDRFLDHHFRKLRRFFPGWDATLILLDQFMTPAFFEKFSFRAPSHYYHNPTPRAEAYVERLVRRSNPSFVSPS